jgi:hypothetical protein
MTNLLLYLQNVVMLFRRKKFPISDLDPKLDPKHNSGTESGQKAPDQEGTGSRSHNTGQLPNWFRVHTMQRMVSCCPSPLPPWKWHLPVQVKFIWGRE